MATVLPMPPARKLPTPQLGGPAPVGCDAAVAFKGVLDGADVVVVRERDGTEDRRTWDLDWLWHPFNPHLDAAGDRLHVTQEMPQCARYLASDALVLDVPPATAPGAPVVSPPCQGAPLVHISGLVPGAALRVAVGADISYEWVVPGTSTAFDAPVGSLPFPATISATQTRCRLESPAGTAEVIEAEQPRPPEVVGPLYACAQAVSVRTRPGAWVFLLIRTRSGGERAISKLVHADSDTVKIAVHPALPHPDGDRPAEVWALQLCCGGDWQRSERVSVFAHPPLQPLILPPLFSGATSITIGDALAGARVTVFAESPRNGLITVLGESVVTALHRVVSLSRPLEVGERVWAVQQLCSATSGVELRTLVIAGTKTFYLDHPRERPLPRGQYEPAVLKAASVTLTFAGKWYFHAEIENKNPELDAEVALSFRVNLPHPMSFGLTFDANLAAAEDGLPHGFAALGYKSSLDRTDSGAAPHLSDFPVWLEVLKATGKFDWLVGWTDHEPIPEAPDGPEE